MGLFKGEKAIPKRPAEISATPKTMKWAPGTIASAVVKTIPAKSKIKAKET